MSVVEYNGDLSKLNGELLAGWFCELAESHQPETDKAMTHEDELKVDEIYQLLSRAMDLPPAASWLDD